MDAPVAMIRSLDLPQFVDDRASEVWRVLSLREGLVEDVRGWQFTQEVDLERLPVCPRDSDTLNAG